MSVEVLPKEPAGALAHGQEAGGEPIRVEPARRGGFAGFSWGQIALGALLLGLIVWNAWSTRELLSLRSKRTVSVSLAAMANDFIASEARAGNSPEQTEADTRYYMAALQTVLKGRADRGETILVSEAVVSSSLPDITAEVRQAVGKLMTANPSPRLPGPPASPPSPQAGSGSAPQVAPPGFPAGNSGETNGGDN